MAALLAIVVEDDEDTRAVRQRDLEAKGFAVIAAETSDDALVAMSDAPAVDLVLTDIHLGGSRRTKAGVALAKKLRQTLPSQLPVVGYSGVFSERQLGEEDLRLFDLTSPRNSMNWSQLDLFFTRCHDLAAEYHEWKRDRASEQDTSGTADVGSHRSRGVFSPGTGDGGVPHIEDALKKAGYELRLVSSEDFEAVMSAVPAWIRLHEENGQWEAQIYGFPVLHTFAATDGEAVSHLVALMQSFKRDLDSAVAQDKHPRGPAAALHQFLSRVLRS